MSDDNRLEDIRYWWSGGFPGAFSVADHLEPRLQSCFERVLLAMSDEHFEAFISRAPTIICNPGIYGEAFSYHLGVPPGADVVKLHVLYFSERVARWADDRLAALVAHEVAHIVLGHGDGADYRHGMRGSETENAADVLAEQWGFRRAYSKAELARLHRLETALDARRAE